MGDIGLGQEKKKKKNNVLKRKKFIGSNTVNVNINSLLTILLQRTEHKIAISATLNTTLHSLLHDRC